MGASARRVLLLLVLLLFPSFAQAAAAATEGRTLLLAVQLNGRDTGIIVETQDTGGQAAISAEDLHTLGLRPPDSKPDALVPLSSISGLHYRIEDHRQVLVLDAEDAALLSTTLGASPTPAPIPAAQAGWGAVFNYDVLGTQASTRDGGSAMSGLFDAHAYSPYGIVGSGLLATGSPVNSPAGGQSGAVRLDTNYIWTDEGGMRRWQAGDVLSGGLRWTRPFRLGGLQIASDFTVRPDLVTYPMPQITGRTAAPSTVDVLVNGVRQMSQDVQSGPFEVRQPPIVTGAGDIAVVVRDSLGQETVQNLSFYASPDLLKPGLASYSVETGYTRSGYGVVSNDYRQPAALGTLRYGVSDWLTAETHAEASERVTMAGVGAAIDVFGLGMLSTSVAVSQTLAGTADNAIPLRDGDGVQYSIGFEHLGRWYSISASTTRSLGRFADIPAATGDPVPVSTTRAGFGVSLGRWGSVHAAYVDVRRALLPQVTGQSRTQLQVGDARIASVTYARPISEKISFYATAYKDFASSASSGVNFGISMALGSRTSASASVAATDAKPAAYVDAAQSAVNPGDWGWHAGVSQDQSPQQVAEGTYLGQSATVTAGLGHVQSGPSNIYSGRAGIQGALVFTQNTLFATNRVGDSFAVVNTGGIPNVPVLQENRLVGKTGADGLLLVPGLRGWEQNRLAIDPSGLPPDLDLGKPQQMVRPPTRSGIAVDFSVKHSDAAMVQLVDRAGKPIPAGAMAKLRRTGKMVPVGYDGDVYLNGLQGTETLDVETVSARCVASFTYTARKGDIPTIGPIPCIEAAP